MAILSEHAGKTLLHQGGSFEPQRKSNFALMIPGVLTENLMLSLKSTPIPPVGLTKQSIKYFNETVHYPGAVAPWESQTLVFRDYLDVDTVSALSVWYRQTYNPETGAIGWARDYKKSGEIYLLPPGMPGGGSPGTVQAAPFQKRVWDLQGLWIEKMDSGDLDHDDDGSNVEISLTLSIDKAIPVSMK